MKLLKLTLLSFVAFSLFVTANAQQCGFDQLRQIQMQNPEFLAQEQLVEERIQNAMLNNNSSRMNGSVLTIPVVVHVLHLGEAVGTGTNISDAQIQSSIDNLNYKYRGQDPNSPVDFEIEFALAQRDPSCNPSTGINRIDASGVANYSSDGVSFQSGPGADENTLKDLSRWPETDYFNIWIVTEINGNNGGGGYQGYANFYYGNAYEGSVMMYTVFGYDPTNANPSWNLNFSRDNSTVVHEAGHYFHLFHTFQGDGNGSDCPADSTVGTDSDGCADTVPHRRETSTCPTTNSCTGNPWVDNNTINNIMSYYNCTDRLTNDQKTRARGAMQGTSLVNSKGATPIDSGYAPPTSVCSTNSTSTNSAGIVSVELNGVTFTSFSSASDGGNIDLTANCSNYFEIDATESNTVNVGMFPVNFQQLGVWIDWNDDGDFDDSSEQQHFSQDIPQNTTVSITLTYPATIPYGDYVRIRLITDYDDRYSGASLINSPCSTSLARGQSEDYTIYIQPQGTTNYVYDNGWSPGNPDGVATADDDIDIMNGDVTISSNTECNTLTISPTANLTVDSGVTLTTNTLTLNSTSDQFSSLILDGAIAGNVIYNRYISAIVPVASNDLIATPLSGQAFGDFATANSNLANSGSLYLFGHYDTALGMYVSYDSSTNATTTLNSGMGYRAATIDGSNVIFTGTALSTDVTGVAISDDANGYAWNLLGNPYPSYLDFNAFFQENKDEFDASSPYQAIYGYDGSASNGWTVWNQATIDEGSVTELIAPGQGFFVKAKSGGGSVNFTTAMRSYGSSDDFILGRQSSNNASLCKLNLNSAINETSTQIYFIEGTTRGLDNGYDAATYSNASAFSIATQLVDENTGLNMAIQTLPYEDFNNIVVPLSINVEANTEFTISIDDISSLPSHINVYLEDSEANTLTLLNDNAFVFTPPQALNGTGRFYLHYSATTLSIDDIDSNTIQVYASTLSKTLVVKGNLTDRTIANLYDIQGRLVLSKTLDTSVVENTIDVSGVTTGIYIVKISNDNQTKTQKLIIR